ncbi:hypothetical protein XELAEV_18031336mg [Xenopus laevis]|uniref:Uncharacterized protein n=1 Tax=Xenopus laevis TaxID=8355 RepID=A0A974CMJ2_XENLA|nr:hypothetical protein XELAEV_18031336mg [Xenopus laevis]
MSLRSESGLGAEKERAGSSCMVTGAETMENVTVPKGVKVQGKRGGEKRRRKEVREKIWKRDNIDIFTLLPLERFNIEKWEKGKEHLKDEDEDRRRYRLIPKSFGNWLQAFSIMASVIGEKHPKDCSGLFCYLDSIWKAYRTYGELPGLNMMNSSGRGSQQVMTASVSGDQHAGLGTNVRVVGVLTTPFPGVSRGKSHGESNRETNLEKGRSPVKVNELWVWLDKLSG